MASSAAGTSTVTSSSSLPRDQLLKIFNAEKAKWHAADKQNYKFEFSQSCFCPEALTSPKVISVVNGNVTDILEKESGSAVPEDQFMFYHSVESLMDMVETAIEKADLVTVDFEPNLGYPIKVEVNWRKELSDSRSSYSVHVENSN
eukprot:CAMPEP_0114553788 /NCGR_PEP_ID=MMETSP0114-20121206/7856_1 /TAXON_ID=31324 /ORGANISM="Goniomonas sp, Strain m" /LENGTH=145 /DNA_ID=CAMNT_0001738777 /DNA_START=50 /DNA_END=487 /DNA_ORIENTATION=-